MRIASLVPSATESLFALGLGNQVVAVTHECDHPAGALGLPRLTRSVIPEGLEPQRIDEMVREVTGRGEPLYELDEPQLAEAAPEVLDDLVRLGDAAGVRERGEGLRAELRQRLDRVRDAVAGEARPRVVTLEWLSPPYAGGHWVPGMVEIAGGESVAGEPGRDSRAVTWSELATARPEVAVAMPCGLYAEEAAQQAGFTRIWLSMVDDKALGFWVRMGYEGHYHDGCGNCGFHKRLE